MTQYFPIIGPFQDPNELLLLDPAKIPLPGGITYGDVFRQELPPEYVPVKDLPDLVSSGGTPLTVVDIQARDFTKLYAYAAIQTTRVAAIPDDALIRWEAYAKARCQEPYGIGFECIWVTGGIILWCKAYSYSLPLFHQVLIGEGGICTNTLDPSYETIELPDYTEEFSEPDTFIEPGINCAAGYLGGDVWGGFKMPHTGQIQVKGYRLPDDETEYEIMPMTLPDPPVLPEDVPPPITNPCCDAVETAVATAQSTADDALAAAAAAQTTADEALELAEEGGGGVCELTPKLVTRNKFNPLTGAVEMTETPVYVPKDGDNDMGSLFNEILESLQQLLEGRTLPIPSYFVGEGTIGPEDEA